MLNRRRFISGLADGVAAAMLARCARGSGIDASADVERIAQDADRPEYHYLPPHNWMNDPNGPIWWRGKYHLFCQMNPHAAVWGDMHWGHAVSTDMVRWRQQPIALAPTPGGPDSEGCFSGSAVVFQGMPAFLYTGVQNAPPDQATIRDGSDKLRETQLLAVAEDDDLLRWKKTPEPVIAAPPPGMKVTGFRDPCPWREDDGWYLAVGSGERGKGGCVLLYRSADLRQWEYLHPLIQGEPNGSKAANPVDTGEMWECPDFFEMKGGHCLLYSTEGKVIWATGLYDAKTHRFTATHRGVLDHGAYYAPKSFLAPDGRRILWGWIPERRPEAEYSRAGWAGVMSLPRVLRISPQGQLEMHPAAEVEKLRGTAERSRVSSTTTLRRKLATLRQELLLRVRLLTKTIATIRLTIRGQAAWQITIDVPGNLVRCGEIEFPLPGLPWPRPELRMFLDGSVIECFIGGREAITSRVYGMQPGEVELEVAIEGERDVEFDLWPLDRISTDRLTT